MIINGSETYKQLPELHDKWTLSIIASKGKLSFSVTGPAMPQHNPAIKKILYNRIRS